MTNQIKNNDAMPHILNTTPETHDQLKDYIFAMNAESHQWVANGIKQTFAWAEKFGFSFTRPEAQETADTPDFRNPDFDVGDLLFALEMWGNLQYKDGCEWAHHLLLKYRDDIYKMASAAEKQPVDLEALVLKTHEEINLKNGGKPYVKAGDISQTIHHLAASGHLAPDLASVKEALEVAELWLVNCMPIVTPDGPTPLPLIRKALADLGLYAKSVEGK